MTSFQSPVRVIEELTPDLTGMVLELNRRLENSTFSPRDGRKSRRNDGVITLDRELDGSVGSLQIRLNAFESGLSAVLKLNIRSEVVSAHSLMVRTSTMGADDRGQVIIPQLPTAPDFPVIENIIYSACTCLHRGQVTSVPVGELHSSQFYIFLPSKPQLAKFSSDFSISGLSSLY
jgi:hypothetical protein